MEAYSHIPWYKVNSSQSHDQFPDTKWIELNTSQSLSQYKLNARKYFDVDDDGDLDVEVDVDSHDLCDRLRGAAEICWSPFDPFQTWFDC